MNMDFEALLAKILTIKEGHRLAYPFRQMNFIIESNCLTAINQINQKSDVDCRIECWIEEIRALSQDVASVVFNFCPRVCNGVADRIAKVANSCKINADWVYSVPNWIVNHLLLDNCPYIAHVAS